MGIDLHNERRKPKTERTSRRNGTGGPNQQHRGTRYSVRMETAGRISEVACSTDLAEAIAAAKDTKGKAWVWNVRTGKTLWSREGGQQ